MGQLPARPVQALERLRCRVPPDSRNSNPRGRIIVFLAQMCAKFGVKLRQEYSALPRTRVFQTNLARDKKYPWPNLLYAKTALRAAFAPGRWLVLVEPVGPGGFNDYSDHFAAV